VSGQVLRTGRGRRRAWRLSAGLLSGVAHGVILLALIGAASDQTPALEPAPISIQLIELPPLVVPAPTLDPQPTPSPKQPAPQTPKRQSIARRSPVPPVPAPLPVAPAEHTAAVASQGVDNARFAGAQGVGDGPPSGACDMARRLQAALRKDPLVQAAVARAGGGPIMVWDGDWVQNGAEDGKGLAAVREAITWEVAFAPAACKAEPMRGMILLSMNEPGSAKLALGEGAWRWSDLLR
jgi:hypothetical protein